MVGLEWTVFVSLWRPPKAIQMFYCMNNRLMKITLNVLHNVYYILLNFSFSLKSTMLLAILQLVVHCWPKPDAAIPSKCTVASNNLWAFLISIFYQRISINQLKWIIFAHCHMRCKFKLICELIKMLVHSRSTKAIAEPGQLVVGRRCCCCWVFHSNCNGFVDK